MHGHCPSRISLNQNKSCLCVHPCIETMLEAHHKPSETRLAFGYGVEGSGWHSLRSVFPCLPNVQADMLYFHHEKEKSPNPCDFLNNIFVLQ